MDSDDEFDRLLRDEIVSEEFLHAADLLETQALQICLTTSQTPAVEEDEYDLILDDDISADVLLACDAAELAAKLQRSLSPARSPGSSFSSAPSEIHAKAARHLAPNGSPSFSSSSSPEPSPEPRKSAPLRVASNRGSPFSSSSSSSPERRAIIKPTPLRLAPGRRTPSSSSSSSSPSPPPEPRKPAPLLQFPSGGTPTTDQEECCRAGVANIYFQRFFVSFLFYFVRDNFSLSFFINVRSESSDDELDKHSTPSTSPVATESSSFQCPIVAQRNSTSVRVSLAHTPRIASTPINTLKRKASFLEQPLPLKKFKISCPLEEFFADYPDFDYDATLPVSAQYGALCRLYGFRRGNPDAEVAYQGYQRALTRAFQTFYGTDVDDLATLQSLCRVLEVAPIPQTVWDCQTTLRQVHVNIVDLIDWAKSDSSVQPPKRFDTQEELAKYTCKTRKFFRLEDAEDTLLEFLLRRVLPERLYSFDF
ncbi:Zinc finger, C2H2-like [Mycena sanguinolenta]|uniref:Zinc finger, C2H2-like n=1 Tax=Mycena sanguinolenta TaxID=230812 RepID=A0A8H6XB53_9AGAR|nr:Zinc finger, C2H2-like [Mycena sanguinolenta]